MTPCKTRTTTIAFFRIALLTPLKITFIPLADLAEPSSFENLLTHSSKLHRLQMYMSYFQALGEK